MSKLPMKSRRKSIIWKIPKEELQSIIDDSDSIKKVLNALGLQGVTGGNRDTLAKRIEEDDLDMRKLYHNRDTKQSERRKTHSWERKFSNEQMFTKNSNRSRATIRNRILKDNLIDYCCSDCQNTGEYNNKPLALQLDHINGINDDNRLENLRFLCPNCHSQTDTFAGKKRK